MDTLVLGFFAMGMLSLAVILMVIVLITHKAEDEEMLRRDKENREFLDTVNKEVERKMNRDRELNRSRWIKKLPITDFVG